MSTSPSIARRALLKAAALAPVSPKPWEGSRTLARWGSGEDSSPAPRRDTAAKPAGASPLQPLAADLLRDWCDGLLRLQIDEPARPERHGAFRCPACGTLHGRCADAVYPLMHMARATGQDRYRVAALKVVDWMKNVESPDGAWLNNPHDPTSWKGITVFGAIALAEALRRHGELLEAEVRRRWLARLRRAAQFIDANFNMDYANVNYPVTASWGLTLLGEVLDDPKLRARGRQFAHDSLQFLTTPSHLLYGEGKPQKQRSPKGLLPVDLGYNVEESLPSLALYAITTGDHEVLEAVTAALAGHLELMLPDGGWDNSWGTRNFKWTYWGSRTSDGCQTAYALLADRRPAFATAALRNTQLLRACTHEGLLHGGPHYAAQGVPPCVHHTFCHAKALATVLDHRLPAARPGPLPRETARGARKIPELDVLLVAQGPWRGTISGYDWLYKPGVFSGMGGALSLLWHRDLGPVFSSSLATYIPVEPNNMQPLPGKDFCLTPRVESRLQSQDRWWSNVFFRAARIEADGSVFTRLVDASQKDPPAGPVSCQLQHRFTDAAVTIAARVVGGTPPAPATLVLPLISAPGERVRRLSDHRVEVQKGRHRVVVESTAPLHMEERVFNLVPGFCAIPLTAEVGEGITIRIEA
jgi:hypothetical protein